MSNVPYLLFREQLPFNLGVLDTDTLFFFITVK